MMKFLNSGSIYKKLMLLVLFAVMPCLAILLYSGIELRTHLIEDAQSDVLLISHNMALAQKEVSESTKQILSTLSLLPSIQTIDSTASSIILRAVLERNPNFINIALVDLSGDVLASSSHFTGVNFADRKHVKDALEKLEFSVGEYIFTRIGVVTPGFTFAYPVLDKEDRPKAVLTVAVKLDIFSKLYDVETLPEKSFVAVTDHKGIRLFYYPTQEDTNPVGKPIRTETWDIVTKGKTHGFFSAAGSDGLRRIVAYEKVFLSQKAPPYLYVWAGIPETHLLKAANASLVRNLLFMLLGTVISLTIAWVIGKNTLISPIQSLIVLTRKFSQGGKLKGRSELPANSGEIGTLTSAFYDMADALNVNQKTLRESEKKYRQLFNNVPAGIYEINFEKVKLINVNEVFCKYSGYSEEELLTMNPLDLLTENSKNLFIGRFEKISAGKNLKDSAEYDIIKKDGQKVCVILNNDYIYKNGKLIGSRVVAHDITELKQAQEERIKAHKIAGEQKKLALVGQVAGKMAHDFNNILGIIMGNTELSLLDCEEPNTKKTLKLIYEQTIRGKNLTKNLLAFAKDQEPKQAFFRINEKIDLVLNLMIKDLEGIQLLKEESSGVPELLADPGMIEHTVVNLIQNSIHALSMVKYPKIIIRTYGRDNYICFEIEDNGCGISNENLKNIYEPSFTLKGNKDVTGSYKVGIKGTGYGMSNVKKYVEQHKGSISIESELGSGTKLTISFPVIRKELTSEEKIEIQTEKIYFEKYILLVEDEMAISEVQYRILTQEPYNHKVDIANNGQIATDLFGRNKYDLVSLDYILPGGINGMDIYHHIRLSDKTIPILFISGNIEFLESIKGLKQKDTKIDHLSKPCQNKDFVNGINKLLEKSFAEQ